MEYNTTRDKLKIAEYGRNIQKLIQEAIEIEDKETRTKFAKVIVQVMGQMNPAAKESGDFKHKLWDHLHIMADFKLDVDAPYPAPSPEVLMERPKAIPYSDNKVDFRMYGSNIKRIIEKAVNYEEGPEKDALIEAIANHMKKSYLAWNRESVDDSLIFEHFNKLSNGKVVLSEEMKLDSTNEILARNRKKKTTAPPQRNNPKFKGKKRKPMPRKR